MRVALASASAARGLDDDEPALVDALAQRAVEATPAVWDDPAVDWAGFDLVVVRSTWDYPERLDEFLAWAEHVESATRLRNPVAVLRWNTDKRYLRRVEQAGLATVPSVWAEPGTEPRLPGDDVVVKPAVSAGARDTARYAGTEHAAALAHVRRLHADGRTAMVQPYLPEIADGEVALIFVAGVFSHSVRKHVTLGAERALFARERLGHVEPTASEHSLAEHVLALLVDAPDQLLYARVDLVRTALGPLLLEVELTEPSLFLSTTPGATERFADAVAREAAVGQG